MNPKLKIIPSSAPPSEELYLHHELKVPVLQNATRLDRFLPKNMRQITRTQAQKMISEGAVRVNDVVRKASTLLHSEDTVSLWFPFPPAPPAGPEAIPLNILYEDDDILVIYKESGMVCHPNSGYRTGTLFQGVLHYLGYTTNRKDHKEGDDWPGIVHRLDKDTSGILVMGKHYLATVLLAKQFMKRTVHRSYHAIVWNQCRDQTIQCHIADSPEGRYRRTLYPDGSAGKYAITHCKVLETFPFATLVQCKLETGRSHQIRIHLNYVGNPLWGDIFYDGSFEENQAHHDDRIKRFEGMLNRVALHARTLSFLHPMTQKKMSFEAEPPEDFATLLKELRALSHPT